MKNYLKCSLLAITTLMALVACNGGGRTTSEDPNKEVLDPGNTQVAFKEIENNILINKAAQDYIDKMHEQEKLAEHPFRFSALDDHDNIEVKNELSQNISRAEKLNRPIKISWDKEGLTYDKINVVVSKSWKFDDYATFETTGDFVEIDNLRRAQTYYYRLENEDKSIQSQVQKFETADYTRSMNFDGEMQNGNPVTGETIYNVRDEGGYMTSFGIRTAQGLIYRGSEINDAKFGQHGKNVDDLVLQKQRDVFKIGAELDLRKKEDVSPNNQKDICALGEDVEYYRYSFNNFTNFIKDPDNGTPGTLKAAFDVLANADQKPVYFHCWGGADRTGALGLFLNGMLGVSLTDLYIDYELTTQYNSLRSHLTANGSYDMPGMLKLIRALPYYDDEKSIASVCKQFLMEHGVEEDTIEKIREFMLPGYTRGMEEVID